MIQFINISDTVNRDEIKKHNELLNLINATVSHELRNPLNSIVSQAMQNRVLFDEINEILTYNNLESRDIIRLKIITEKLLKG